MDGLAVEVEELEDVEVVPEEVVAPVEVVVVVVEPLVVVLLVVMEVLEENEEDILMFCFFVFELGCGVVSCVVAGCGCEIVEWMMIGEKATGLVLLIVSSWNVGHWYRK